MLTSNRFHNIIQIICPSPRLYRNWALMCDRGPFPIILPLKKGVALSILPMIYWGSMRIHWHSMVKQNLLVTTSVTAKEHFINPKFFFKEVVNLCTVICRNSSIVKSFFIMWDDGWDFLWFEGSQHLPFSQYGNGQVRDLSHKNGVSLYLLYLQSGI